MRSYAVSVALLVVFALPRICSGQVLGPDAYFSSAAAVQQALMLLPPPPAPGTAAQAANVQLLNSVMIAASPQAVAKAQADAVPSVFDFSAVLGTGFNAQDLPVTNSFFNKVTINTQNTNISLDRIYNSQGPVTASSYPSAHTVLGFVDGMILSAMIPEKQDQLTTYGVQFGLNRLILGQHWPTDVGAGQMEAGILLFDLNASPQFQSDLGAAKAELRAQQGLK
ncbi:phosphatase PAP2 family protein [Fundidesulfovibrio terrae]|uniref:phosphatase PAP2 family protein n=1 Tax=Fundidesulfovibrio terrae TaxID=2922866 RepID=UPI001FB00A5B|nr:phosphatase PAP2 family protein [Fundidesulfovibrio terrae]